ncbi:hypothetical protein ACLQ3C_00130 [Gordonia sp. DT30]|uniref:hypothetical protein n=1 Tax=unclassified Gordonia (in: high G+C Gram-positive bacteria) TaxID=2657482 RepID=UPI003CF7633B
MQRRRGRSAPRLTVAIGSASGQWAQPPGALGLPFAYAHHFAHDGTEQILGQYRSAFTPSRFLDEPHVMITAMLVAADTPERVRAQTMTTDMTHLALLRGARPQPVEIERALVREFTIQERAAPDQHHARQVIGTPDGVAERLRELAAST